MHEVQNGWVCGNHMSGTGRGHETAEVSHVTLSPHVVVLAVVGLVQLPGQSEGHREVKITLHPMGRGS